MERFTLLTILSHKGVSSMFSTSGVGAGTSAVIGSSVAVEASRSSSSLGGELSDDEATLDAVETADEATIDEESGLCTKTVEI